ncbi:hypothetical protein F2P81_019587 [Scophthalmus maximus]|uniref:Uncharacterized protein n=1 Tax=Scophthalmus maximus TaxID=52904 RepID=A0A6A4SA26_SCOMX|nr:hypothetical protein F2P81_019587 [Scophthalmus maximus]
MPRHVGVRQIPQTFQSPLLLELAANSRNHLRHLKNDSEALGEIRMSPIRLSFLIDNKQQAQSVSRTMGTSRAMSDGERRSPEFRRGAEQVLLL